MMCFILLSDDAGFNQEIWSPPAVDDLPFRVRVADVSRNEDEIVEFKLASASEKNKDSGSIFLAKMPAMAPDDDAQPGALWPTFSADLASHQSHWILTTFGSDFSPVDEALLQTRFTSTLLRSFPTALGVLWNKHGLRVSADHFQAIVESLEPDELPTPIWIDTTVIPPVDAKDHPIALTTGMDAFDLMEIECMGSQEPSHETHRRIEGICEYLLNNGPVLQHGHTIGESESEKISIIHAPSALGREGNVIHLVYGESQDAAGTPLWQSAIALVGVLLAALALIVGIVSLVDFLTHPAGSEPSVAVVESVETEQDTPPRPAAASSVSPAVRSEPFPVGTVTRTPLVSETPDWSDADEIDLTGADSWSLPEGSQAFESFRALPIRVSLQGLLRSRVDHVVVNPFSRRALAVATGPTRDSRVNTRIAVGDLDTGQVLQSVTVPDVTASPMAYSETRKMAWMSSGQSGNKLEGWQIDGDEVERSQPWDPFGGVPDPQLPPRRSGSAAIRFVDAMAEATLVVGNQNGHVVIWDIHSMRPQMHYHVGRAPAWAVTPNGRLLALATSKELTILDITARRLVAKRSLSDLGSISWPKLDFSPDGSELYLSSVSRNVIFSTANGTVTDDFAVSGLSTRNGAIFVDAGHVLVNGTHLISRTAKQTVHRLQGLGVPISFDRYTYAMAQDASEMVVWPIKLPIDLAKRNDTGPAVLTTSGLQ